MCFFNKKTLPYLVKFYTFSTGIIYYSLATRKRETLPTRIIFYSLATWKRETFTSTEILSNFDKLFNCYFLSFISSNICCFNLSISVKNTLIPLLCNFINFLNFKSISFCKSVPTLAGAPFTICT